MMDGLTPNLTGAYLKQVDRQRAAFLLEMLRVVLAPHMSESSRRDLISELQRRAKGDDEPLVTLSSNAAFDNYVASLVARK